MKNASSKLHVFIGQVYIQYSLHNTPALPARYFCNQRESQQQKYFGWETPSDWRALPPGSGFHHTLHPPKLANKASAHTKNCLNF